MKTYRFEIVDEQDMIALDWLSKLTETYQHLDEEDLDVTEIYNRRTTDYDSREIVFD
jgi:hypothetical protein